MVPCSTSRDLFNSHLNHVVITFLQRSSEVVFKLPQARTHILSVRRARAGPVLSGAVLIVKRLYTLLVVRPFLVLTKFMVADIFTKALDRDAFITFRDYMLNVENGPESYARGKAGRLLDKLMSALHK